MRTWRLLVGIGAGISSIGLWSAPPAHAEAPATPAEAPTTPAEAPPAQAEAPTTHAEAPPAKAPQAAKPKCKSGMVGIPAGTFTMGDDVHTSKAGQVTVAAYCIDRTEVTTAAYGKCVKAGKCTAADTNKDYTDVARSMGIGRPDEHCNFGVAGRGNHPINCVYSDVAEVYCKAQGLRLPTEEEWEYAARGTDGRIYPWGNAEPSNQLCWDGPGNNLGEGNRKSTCAVASFPAGNSPFGVADMAGNVWEITSSTFGIEDSRAVFGDSAWVGAKVLRGSGWRVGAPSWVRSAVRYGQHPMPEGNPGNWGFRCAGSPSDASGAPADAKLERSGLRTKVLKPGTGKEHPHSSDTVKVHYTGWTTDGKMFYSSLTRGTSDELRVDGVIKGVAEGLQLMVAGESRRYWIPADLAFGETASRPGAPVGALVFDVELLEIQKGPEPPATPKDLRKPPATATKTKSGLRYRSLVQGKGTVHPKATDKVSVHYSGWSKDGKLFDSSVTRGKPAVFSLNSVIAGWTEGVQLMVQGDKVRFWIPGDLAYGDTPKRPGAPAGQLVFDVELLEIQ